MMLRQSSLLVLAACGVLTRGVSGSETDGCLVKYKTDFTEDINGKAFTHGSKIGTKVEFDGNVVFTARKKGKNGPYNDAMIFDAATQKKTTDEDLTHDPDQGNLLMISEDGSSSNPDDNAKGGDIMATFSEEVTVNSIALIDMEQTATFTFYDEKGETIASKSEGGGKDGEVRRVRFKNGVEGVRKMKVVMTGSGAIDDLTFSRFEYGCCKCVKKD